MRSKTLSSDFTIFKKDLTRFAPVWLSLCAWLVIWGSSIRTDPQSYSGSSFYEPIAPIFAPIMAIVVFGYLCDPKECHMVHSLPIRRERLFLIHTAAALLMYLIPTAVFCFATRNYAAQGAMYRLLFLMIEFVFLFSIGVLCVMLTGRKIGAALLYIFGQSFSIILGVILEALYLPLVPGVALNSNYLLMSPTLIVSSYADFIHNTKMGTDEWSFLIFFSVLSLVILLVSMVLYRRRKLEHAGDLLAVQWLDPFFAICSGLTGGSLMIFFGFDSGLIILLVGTVIGWFGYWMLSKKTARVFTLKLVGGYVGLIAALAGSMYLTFLDPLDRVHYVPEPHQVAEASLSDYQYSTHTFDTADTDLIADLTALHADLVSQYDPDDPAEYLSVTGDPFVITYKLENGRTILREYYCDNDMLMDRAAWFLSQPIALFDVEDPIFTDAEVRNWEQDVSLDPSLLPGLYEVILKECREGRMYSFDNGENNWSIHLQVNGAGGYTYLNIPDTAVDTIAWLEANCVPLS